MFLQMLTASCHIRRERAVLEREENLDMPLLTIPSCQLQQFYNCQQWRKAKRNVNYSQLGTPFTEHSTVWTTVEEQLGCSSVLMPGPMSSLIQLQALHSKHMLYWLQSMDWIQCCCCGWSTMEMGFVDRPFVFPASLHSFSSSSPSLQSPSLTIVSIVVTRVG